YLTNFKLDHTGEDTLPSANFTADFGGALTTLTLTAPHRAFWIDANSSITFQPVITPNPNRWVLNSVSEASAFNPGNFTVLYFDQYPLTVSFAISSGAAPSGPVLTATADGQPLSLELYSGAPPTWVDASSGFTLSSILQGSTSLERWVAVSGTSGLMLGPKSVDLLYYHQVWVSLYYAVVGGGVVSPFNATFVSLGSQNSTLVTGTQAGSWMDVGTTLSVPSTFLGSSSQERWELGSASAYPVQAPQALSLAYYHQFNVPTGYTVVGGGSPVPPLTGVKLGVPFTAPIASGEVWLDSGSLFSISQSLQGASGERWYDSGPLNGTVGPQSTIMPSYQHQYLVTLTADPQGGGSLNGGGWVASGSTAAITVTTSGGYLFVSWAGTGAGSYSGPNQSTPLSVAGPIVETANFYVGISIQVVGRGSVQVSFGSSTYSVVGRTALFLPAGTNITMIARPSAFETFSGWSGMAAGNAGAVLLTVVSPMGISAVFALNQVEALAVVALCFGGGAYGIAYFTWKKRVSPGRLLSGTNGSGKDTG
ncbi:MAG TPA: hypothetical protein VEH01_03575, partial [Nitrososphaerales archaeon]|nr:hypothetical protein [Nitrososphaerales archaeon]